jgi:hypothetical protein
MYPAIEIDLHFGHICAAQRQNPGALGAAFRVSTYGTNLLPLDAISPRRADRCAVIAETADGGRRRGVKPTFLTPRSPSSDDAHRRPADPAHTARTAR